MEWRCVSRQSGRVRKPDLESEIRSHNRWERDIENGWEQGTKGEISPTSAHFERAAICTARRPWSGASTKQREWRSVMGISLENTKRSCGNRQLAQLHEYIYLPCNVEHSERQWFINKTDKLWWWRNRKWALQKWISDGIRLYNLMRKKYLQNSWL